MCWQFIQHWRFFIFSFLISFFYLKTKIVWCSIQRVNGTTFSKISLIQVNHCPHRTASMNANYYAISCALPGMWFLSVKDPHQYICSLYLCFFPKTTTVLMKKVMMRFKKSTTLVYQVYGFTNENFGTCCINK